jgi:hypothetical protein
MMEMAKIGSVLTVEESGKSTITPKYCIISLPMERPSSHARGRCHQNVELFSLAVSRKNLKNTICS